MQKVYFPRLLQAALLALLCGALAACFGGGNDIKKGTSDAANAPASYDLTIAADKDGQFDFDGATIDRETLRGHIRYLNESGRPVHTILLKPGEKEKIKNTHIGEMAGIARDLKVTAYVKDNDGHLKVINVVE
jgi:hypothetical protein